MKVPKKPPNQQRLDNLEYYRAQAVKAGNYYAQLLSDATAEDWQLDEASESLDYWLGKVDQEELYNSGF